MADTKNAGVEALERQLRNIERDTAIAKDDRESYRRHLDAANDRLVELAKANDEVTAALKVLRDTAEQTRRLADEIFEQENRRVDAGGHVL